MTKYLISFPSAAMQLTEADFVKAGEDSRAVVREAKEAGVWVFGGGIAEDVPAVTVAQDGTVSNETHPETRIVNGGFTVLEVADRETALDWARRIAVGCHTPQEVREFMYDPES